MIRPLRPLVLVVLAGLALTACKKDADPQAIPVPSASTVAEAPPQPTAAADATATAATSATPPPPVAVAPVQQQPIDSCCSALSSAAGGAKKGDKDKLLQASKICSGISALVKSGKTQRASALTTIRGQLG